MPAASFKPMPHAAAARMISGKKAVARATFVELDGVVQPAPAPRFDRTPAAMPVRSLAGTADAVLARWVLAAT